MCTCPPKYSLSPYTGCGHRCLYCYITSYIRDGFNPRAKKNLLNRLIRDLKKINHDIPVSMSNSSDPYPPIEKQLGLTASILKILARAGIKVQIITKSSLLLRDLDIILKGNMSVSITITTISDSLARILEPAAPPPSERLETINILTKAGIPCSARIDPIIPGLNDDYNMLATLIKKLTEVGVKHVISSTYKAKTDSLKRLTRAFPDKALMLKELYLEKGILFHGYRYLPEKRRYRILKDVGRLVSENGMTFAVCREGFTNLNTGETCDGTHLIPLRVKYRGGIYGERV